jgi:hypothetical protein
MNAGMGHGCTDAVGFVTDDGEDIIRRNDPSGRCDHMSEKRLAGYFVQDLGKLRLEPCAFAGSHDGDSDAGSRRCESFRRNRVSIFLHSPHYTLSRNRTERGRLSSTSSSYFPARRIKSSGERSAISQLHMSTEEEMPKYVIEREIPGVGSLPPDQFLAISQKSCSVLKNLGPQIQWLESYVTQDKIYCVYIAPNEAMVREHAKQGGFPANRVSEVKRIIDPTSAEA